jgi:hypothetical protein
MGTYQRHWSSSSPLASGEPFFCILPSNWDASKTSTNRAIFGFHGAGSGPDDKSYALGGPFYDHIRALVEAGYAVLAADFGGNSTWGSAIQAYDRPRDMYTYATTTLGVSSSHIGLMGHSMGGQGVLNYIRNCYAASISPGNAAWLWSPLTDLEAIYNSGTYVPAYTPGYPDSQVYTTSGAVSVTAGTATSITVTTTISGPAASGTLVAPTSSVPFNAVNYSAFSGTTFTIPTTNTFTGTIPSGSKIYTHMNNPGTGYTSQVASAHGLTGALVKNAVTSTVQSGSSVQLTAAVPRQVALALTQGATVTFTLGGTTMTAVGAPTTTTITADTLVGVSSSGVSATWAANAALTFTYASVSQRTSPLANISGFRTAIGTMPIKVATATDDEVLGWNSQAYWLSQLALANVTQRSPAITGGHTALFPNVPTSEVVAFFNSYV